MPSLAIFWCNLINGSAGIIDKRPLHSNVLMGVKDLTRIYQFSPFFNFWCLFTVRLALIIFYPLVLHKSDVSIDIGIFFFLFRTRSLQGRKYKMNLKLKEQLEFMLLTNPYLIYVNNFFQQKKKNFLLLQNFSKAIKRFQLHQSPQL